MEDVEREWRGVVSGYLSPLETKSKTVKCNQLKGS